jgi:hypothetical protein
LNGQQKANGVLTVVPKRKPLVEHSKGLQKNVDDKINSIDPRWKNQII